MTVRNSVVFFICFFIHVDAGKSSVGTLDRRQISCRENLEYPHADFCCLNCLAGQYVEKACESAGERGICKPCEYGTFTEHENGLGRCLTCTKCRKDQEVTEICTSTKDTECQCRAGTFCVTEQACEVCKKCTKCKLDEEVVKNCTSTSNSVCKKKPPTTKPVSGSLSPVGIAAVIMSLLVVLLVIGLICWKKGLLKKTTEICGNACEVVIFPEDADCERTVEERQNRQNTGLEESEPEPETQPFLLGVGAKPPAVEDEDRGLGDSLPNTTNSSQTSLSTQPRALPSKSPHPSPQTQRQPIIRDGCCRRLVPLKGEESLMKAFDIIEKNLSWKSHNRFFRLIGLSDNTINDPDSYSSGDRVYKLLKSWMEKEGLKADLNDLIRALLQLNQKLSAENVIQEVIDLGYFRFEDDSS